MILGARKDIVEPVFPVVHVLLFDESPGTSSRSSNRGGDRRGNRSVNRSSNRSSSSSRRSHFGSQAK